jgi:hypothetical protein
MFLFDFQIMSLVLGNGLTKWLFCSLVLLSIFDSLFDLFFIYFSDVDLPASDSLFDLTLNVGRHSYGSNLATAVLYVQQDSEINRQNEDRFQVSGLPFDGRPLGIAAQKASCLKTLNELLANWYPIGTRPHVLNVYIPRHYAPPGARSMPPMIFIFADSKIAAQVRIKLFSHFQASPILRRSWKEPVLTLATHVRIEILLAIRRVLSDSFLRCSVQRTGCTPLLHVASRGRDRVYGFVQSCELFGNSLTANLSNCGPIIL